MKKNTMDNCLNQIKDIASAFPTNDIFIIGKGPSIDLVNHKIFENSLVLGVLKLNFSITVKDFSLIL